MPFLPKIVGKLNSYIFGGIPKDWGFLKLTCQPVTALNINSLFWCVNYNTNILYSLLNNCLTQRHIKLILWSTHTPSTIQNNLYVLVYIFDKMEHRNVNNNHSSRNVPKSIFFSLHYCLFCKFGSQIGLTDLQELK